MSSANMVPFTITIFFVLTIIFSPCLSQTITARAQLPYGDPHGLQEELGVPHGLEPLNMTVIDHLNDIDVRGNYKRSPRGIWDPIQKRNNYCFPKATAAFCIDSNLCCTNSALNTGWCCWYTLSCGSPGSCITPVIALTVTQTKTSIVSAYVTVYTSTPYVNIVTVVISQVQIVTISNVATATVVDIVTVTAAPSGNARRWTLDIPSNIIQKPATRPDVEGRKEVEQRSIVRRVLGYFRVKRQAITSIVTAFNTVVVTTTIGITSVVSYLQLQTTTRTQLITSTSAVNAQATIHVISTSTITPTMPASKPASISTLIATSIETSIVTSVLPPITTPITTTMAIASVLSAGSSTSSQSLTNISTNSNAGLSSGNGGGSQLSIGAEAGIGVGAVGIFAIICIILAIWYRRHLKNKNEERDRLATIAAIAAASPQPREGNDSAKMPVSPLSPTSTDNRYSDLKYNQSPMMEYAGPVPEWNEMPATPVPQSINHAYAPITGRGNPGFREEHLQDTYEMHHPPENVQAHTYEMQHPPVEAPGHNY